jgi:hypothetical protein
MRNFSRKGGKRPRTHPKSNPPQIELPLRLCDRLALLQSTASASAAAVVVVRNALLERVVNHERAPLHKERPSVQSYVDLAGFAITAELALEDQRKMLRCEVEYLKGLASRCGKGAP